MRSPFSSPRALIGSLAIAALAAGGLTAVFSGTSSAGPQGGAQVRMLDNCDPATFNAIIGPGTCISSSGGGVPFFQFLATVQATGSHPDWKFKDSMVSMQSGTSLLVRNRGGEDHSFTEVSAFGNGILDPLNIVGDPLAQPVDPLIKVAPKGFPVIHAGGSQTIVGLAPGTHMFQCLIHPWMRTVVTVS